MMFMMWIALLLCCAHIFLSEHIAGDAGFYIAASKMYSCTQCSLEIQMKSFQ